MNLIRKLQPFNYELKYIPGQENAVADILSRSEVNIIEESDWPTLLPEFLFDKSVPKEERYLRKLLEKEKENFHFDEETGKLYKHVDNKNVLFIPFSRRADLVQEYHVSYGHSAGATIYEIMKDRFWWPNMRNDIYNWIQVCFACQISTKKPTIQEALQPRLPTQPFSRWSIDFIGRLPKTLQGNRWLLVAVDNFTKWPVARAMDEATAANVAKFIYEEIVMPFGCPQEIISDRGANFTAQILEEYLTKLNIHHRLTSAYHPRSNGAVERLNQDFNNILTKYCENHTNRWDEFINQALFTCRIRKHKSTGYSAYELVYGIKPSLPGDSIVPSFIMPDEESVIHERKIDLLKLHDTRMKVKNTLTENARKMKEYFDSTHDLPNETRFKEGDIVLIANGDTGKFRSKWNGPMTIQRAFPLGTYQLINQKGEIKEDLVHGDRLKKANVMVRPNESIPIVSNERGRMLE